MHLEQFCILKVSVAKQTYDVVQSTIWCYVSSFLVTSFPAASASSIAVFLNGTYWCYF